MTTFFEGEIISDCYPFLTRKWDASEEVDRKHWSKFPSFAKYSKAFNTDSFSYTDVKESDSVFMRWKVQSHPYTCTNCITSTVFYQELFLVPDHKITNINGASFAGFYYICFQNEGGTIEGYYYHKMSEW